MLFGREATYIRTLAQNRRRKVDKGETLLNQVDGILAGLKR